MKKILETKMFNVYEYWFKYYVYYKMNNEEIFEYWFDTIEDAKDHINFWEGFYK